MLHENIRYLKKKVGLSTVQVANEIGVSKSSVEKWLTGERKPRLDKLNALADLFGVSIDVLVNGKLVLDVDKKGDDEQC